MSADRGNGNGNGHDRSDAHERASDYVTQRELRAACRDVANDVSDKLRELAGETAGDLAALQAGQVTYAQVLETQTELFGRLPGAVAQLIEARVASLEGKLDALAELLTVALGPTLPGRAP